MASRAPGVEQHTDLLEDEECDTGMLRIRYDAAIRAIEVDRVKLGDLKETVEKASSSVPPGRP